MEALEQLKDPAGRQPVELTGLEVKPAAETMPAPTVEELTNKVQAVGEELRALIVLTKRLPRAKGLDPHQDPTRSLSLAQMYLQTGFMWLRRAIQTPKEF